MWVNRALSWSAEQRLDRMPWLLACSRWLWAGRCGSGPHSTGRHRFLIAHVNDHDCIATRPAGAGLSLLAHQRTRSAASQLMVTSLGAANVRGTRQRSPWTPR